MTEHSLWRFSRALHRAINEREPDDLEALIDDDVDWAVYGPVDMFPFLGARHGKAAVLEVCRQVADNVRVQRFDRESIMLGVDSAAPGFSRVVVRPHLGRLQFVHGSVPHPKGSIEVRVETSGNVTVTSPVDGEFLWRGARREIRAGVNRFTLPAG